MAIADSLIAGETIVFESRKHWMAPIRASLTAGLMVIGAAFVRWLSPSGEGLFGTIGGILDLIALGLFLTGIGWIIYNIVAWRTAEFAVTNMRVLREEGLAKHRSSTTLLSSLSDVKTSVGMLGRQLGYGDITLLTTSGSSGEDRFLCDHPPDGIPRRDDGTEDPWPGRPRSSRVGRAGRREPGGRDGGGIRDDGGDTCPGPQHERRCRDAEAPRRPARQRRDHRRGLRGQEDRDPRQDVIRSGG